MFHVEHSPIRACSTADPRPNRTPLVVGPWQERGGRGPGPARASLGRPLDRAGAHEDHIVPRGTFEESGRGRAW